MLIGYLGVYSIKFVPKQLEIRPTATGLCHFSHQPRQKGILTAPLKGFTTIELMVVISVVGILAALAAPSFNQIIEKWRITETTENLKNTIYYARSEAIRRGGQVGLQKIPQNTDGCLTAKNTADWGCGWFVYVDANDNKKWNSGEEILQRVSAASSVNVTRRGDGASLSLSRWGKIDGNNTVGFTISSTNELNPMQLGLCTSSGGRIRVIQDPPCLN